MNDISADLLLHAYAQGYFPMAKSAHDEEIFWFYPEQRGIIPLADFHVPRSLARFLKKSPFTYTTNRCFTDVITACAQRRNTWINRPILNLYTQLHEMGHAHSVECWQRPDDTSAAARVSLEQIPMAKSADFAGERYILVGGLYGVALGGAFFGESMFSHAPNASKAALVHLVELLRGAGYMLLDAQYVNEHLKQFGVIEISRAAYLEMLEEALVKKTSSCFEMP
ncbi:MAG: leucyl/phenylalanyl-tRNA--protein transferase [Alphaproteobacteria bacterium]